MSKTLAKVRLEMDQGATPPLGWNVDEPWDVIWGKVFRDKEYCSEQVHVPAIAWTARGRASHCKSWQTAPFEAADRHFSQRWKSRRTTQEAALM